MSRKKNRADAKGGKAVAAQPIGKTVAAKAAPAAANAPAAKRGPTLAAWLPPLLLIGAALSAYWNSFAGVFILDDKVRILRAAHIRQLFPLAAVMANTSRPFVELSLAINYALGGVNPWGYHAFNLAVHVLAGLVLFGIVHRMLESARLRPRYAGAAGWLAAVIAIVWTVHPLQTESVTYTIQRAESLMGLCYLLTLYCMLRGAASAHRGRWYLAAVIACWLGMGCKEVMVTAPLLTLLYDRMFLSASFAEALRRRWALYAGLAASWCLLAFLLATSRVEEQAVMVAGLTPWGYALTQFGVIVHYLRLSAWPAPLVLDYAWPLTESVAAALPRAAVVLALLAATLMALLRRFWAGFWGAWFFAVLAPTSSVYPIADIAFEHRMYLPLAAVVVLAVIGAYDALEIAFRRIAAPGLLRRCVQFGLAGAAIVALSTTTARRNEDYRSEYALWSDNVAKRPDNPRAQYTLGNVLDRMGKPTEAISHFSEAVRLKPDYVDPHVNFGAILLAQGKLDEAIAQFTEAVRLKPNSSEAHNNLGAAYFSQGKVKEAVAHLTETVRLNPSAAGPHYNLGVALATQGRFEEAIVQYNAALGIEPNHPEARNYLKAAQANLDHAKKGP